MGFVTRALERDLMLANRLRPGVGIVFDDAECGLHADQLENADNLPADEQKIRAAKVNTMVSGCFRNRFCAEAWCRISSYLSSMAALGYNPLVDLQIALAEKAADMIKMHDPQTTGKKR